MWSKGGYTEYDFMRMKQDAIQRARDMNRRASGGTGYRANPAAQNSTWQQSNSVAEPPPPAETRCPRCGRLIRNGKHVYEARPAARGSPPQSAPSASPFETIHTEYTPPPQDNDKKPTSKSKLTLPLLGDIELDRDFLIIGGLLLVLLSEEGDQLLMLALVYIML